MYWLSADSDPRHEAESWRDYCERSCSEVKTGFQKLMSETDFRKQALEWHPVSEGMSHGLNPLEKLVFIAYFVDGAEWLQGERPDSEGPAVCNQILVAPAKSHSR